MVVKYMALHHVIVNGFYYKLSAPILSANWHQPRRAPQWHKNNGIKRGGVNACGIGTGMI